MARVLRLSCVPEALRGGGDTVWGDNEAGWGDKALGGTVSDRLVGQRGDDDRLEGQDGDDLIVGGPGGDTLYGGPGSDEVDARDGRRDVIDITGSGSGDVVYYDRGIDEFVRASVQSGSAAEAAEATGAELTAQEPPEGLFEPHARVLVDHEGERLLVAEKGLERHLGHGDEIVDPTGRAGAEQGG